MEIEKLSKNIHEVYCKYHKEVLGTEYWTKGNYDLLDEKTKEADRYLARFFIELNKLELKECSDSITNMHNQILDMAQVIIEAGAELETIDKNKYKNLLAKMKESINMANK